MDTARRTRIYLPPFLYIRIYFIFSPLPAGDEDPILFNRSSGNVYATLALVRRGAGGRESRPATSKIKKSPRPRTAEDICLTKRTIKGSARPEYVIVVHSSLAKTVSSRVHVCIKRVGTTDRVSRTYDANKFHRF